jgi:deferrochelatase/peroxidase EfeB
MKIIHKKVITSHVMCENKNKNSTKCHQKIRQSYSYTNEKHYVNIWFSIFYRFLSTNLCDVWRFRFKENLTLDHLNHICIVY